MLYLDTGNCNTDHTGACKATFEQLDRISKNGQLVCATFSDEIP